jgi:tetratricopeptide (TPR) repeat protein
MTQGFLVFLVALCLPVPGQAASPYQAVQQGNAFYQNGKYAEAAAQYGSASQMLPGAAEIHFNQGNAAYKQQDYGKAREHYTQALQTTDRTLEARSNTTWAMSSTGRPYKTCRPQAAMPHLRSAMTYYRDSLDVDPQQQGRVTIWNYPICYCTNCNRSNNSNPQQQQGQPQDQRQQDPT